MVASVVLRSRNFVCSRLRYTKCSGKRGPGGRVDLTCLSFVLNPRKVPVNGETGHVRTKAARVSGVEKVGCFF